MRQKPIRAWRPVLITIFSVLLNYGAKSLCMRFSLPFWFDTPGVLLTGYALGPVSAAIVGFTTNALFSSSNPITLVYGVINAFIGFAVGTAARRGAFRTFFTSATFAAGLALCTSILFTIPNMIFHSGGTDNIWGDAVADTLKGFGLLPGVASFIGEAYIEFADKMIVVLLFRLALELLRRFRSSREKRRQNRNTGSDEGNSTDRPEHSSAAGNAVGGMFLLLLSAAALLVSAVPARAATEESIQFESFRKTVYNASNGLVSGHATDITSAPDGSLWIGSYAGLYRYDGTKFEAQNISAARSVNSVFTDDDGRIWVGTNDSGIILIIDGEVTAQASSKTGLCSDSIRCFVQSADGTYYAGTSDYVEHLRLSDGIQVIGDLTDVPFAKSMAADEEGNVAAVSEDGTLFLIRDGSVTDTLPENGAEESDSSLAADDEKTASQETGFSAVSFDDDGHLFAGTESGVIVEYTVEDGTLSRMGSRSLGASTVINDLEVVRNTEDEVESVLALTDQGLFRTPDEGAEKLDTGDFTHSLQHLAVDYQGNIWIASTRDGLLKLSDSVFTDLFEACGISPHLVNACVRWQNRLYVGCDDGLVVLDEENYESQQSELTRMLDGTRIRYFAVDDEDRLYIATYGQGVVTAEPDGTIMESASEADAAGSRVRTLLTLKDGTVIASGENGISYLKDGRSEKLIPYGEELGSAAPLCFAETSGGVLAGTDGNGLFLIRDGEIAGHFTKSDGLLSNVILKIVPLGEEEGWLLVTSNSLCIYRDHAVHVLESFPYSNNYDVLSGEDGRVYVTGSAGLYITTEDRLLEDRTEDAYLIGPANGLDYSFTVNSQNLLSDDEILLCTGSGLVKVATDRVMDPEQSIRMRIRGISTEDRDIRAEDGTVPILPGDSENVSISAEVINYSDYLPEIKYRLKGYEETWTEAEAGDLGKISYGSLPYGEYAFELVLADRETEDVLEKTVYSFRIDERLADTRIFKVYMIGMVIAFAAWAAWFVTHLAVRRRAEKAKREVEEARTRVAMGNKAVISIARALYAKDELTGQHSYNVAYYSAKLAKAYGFSKSECQNLRKAALLHDIGKIAIPDSVLNKPGRLTNEEYSLMKTHTTVGAEILSGFTLIEHVSEGARYHHERYDGRGYPDGIAGKDIPLYGRIIAVADAYDAMTAKRVYRDKQDVSFAAEEIRKGRGTQFDPELADLFLKLIEEGEVDPEKVRELYQKRDPEEDLMADEDV